MTDPTHPENASATGELLHELQLYGHRPFQDEPDPRPLPESRLVLGGLADLFDALVAMLEDTRLEPDLEPLLWGQVNLFQRAADRIERELDDNEQVQRRLQREQDGIPLAASTAPTAARRGSPATDLGSPAARSPPP